MYNIDSSEEGSYFLSIQTPIVVRHNNPLPMHEEEINSSPITRISYKEYHLTLDIKK